MTSNAEGGHLPACWHQPHCLLPLTTWLSVWPAVVAVGSRDASRAEALLERWGLSSSASAYEGYEAVIADPRVQVGGGLSATSGSCFKGLHRYRVGNVSPHCPHPGVPPHLPPLEAAPLTPSRRRPHPPDPPLYIPTRPWQAVYIALPSALHVPWVKAAATAGKHILLEKPVAVSGTDLEEILRACRDAGVQLMDGTMWAGGGKGVGSVPLQGGRCQPELFSGRNWECHDWPGSVFA